MVCALQTPLRYGQNREALALRDVIAATSVYTRQRTSNIGLAHSSAQLCADKLSQQAAQSERGWRCSLATAQVRGSRARSATIRANSKEQRPFLQCTYRSECVTPVECSDNFLRASATAATPTPVPQHAESVFCRRTVRHSIQAQQNPHIMNSAPKFEALSSQQAQAKRTKGTKQRAVARHRGDIALRRATNSTVADKVISSLERLRMIRRQQLHNQLQPQVARTQAECESAFVAEFMT